MAHARIDKHGKVLPDTGHGCGCALCARSDAPRYERRRNPRRGGAAVWSSLQRRLVTPLSRLRERLRMRVA